MLAVSDLLLHPPSPLSFTVSPIVHSLSLCLALLTPPSHTHRPNLLPLLGLSRRMEAGGFRHSRQIMTVHGKSRTSITSSFVRHAREQEEEGGVSLVGSLRRWPLALLAIGAGPEAATEVEVAAGTGRSQLDMYRDYLRKNCAPILTALHHRDGRADVGTGAGADTDMDTDTSIGAGVGTLTDRELEAVVAELQSQLR